MKKFTMLFVLALFLKMAVAQVTVTITVMNNLSPSTAVSGASVTLTGATTPTVISDAAGVAVFSVPTPAASGYYAVAITAAGYLDYSNSSQVYLTPTSTTVSKSVTIKKIFDITYKITDKNSVAIAGASVKVNTTPATTLTTNATGDVTFSGLYSVANHSTLVTAAGYADSTFNVNVTGSSPNPFIVPTVKLRNAYNITFTVTDGTNPVAGANVTIGTTTVVTDAAGIAAFAKKVNGAYAYSITKTGFVDKNGSVTVADADQAPAITLATGYDLTFTIINGASGTTGLQKDTITIDGITKISGTTGILTFGVAPGSSYTFDNKKAGFITVPVAVSNIMANTAITINMIPVYTVKFTVSDFFDGSKQAGVKVTFNGTDIITDATGIAKYIDVPASATAYAYTISGPDGSDYITQTGTISAPLSSTSYLSNNNNLTKSINYERPYAYVGLNTGFMGYFGAATITFNGVDYPYDAGMGGNFFFVAAGTYSYTVTPDDVTKAIVSGKVTVTNTEPGNAAVTVVNGQKIEMYVTDATPDQNTIDGASVTLDGVTQTTVGGYVVFVRKAINSNYAYTISKEGYGTVTGTAAMVTADLVITTKLETAYKVTVKAYDNSSTSWPPAGLEGATVIFNGNTAVTDVDGIAILPDEPNGTYDYTVTKEGFVTVKGSAYIEDADAMVEVYMKPAYSVQFTVTDGTNPIPNASIRLVSGWPEFDQTFMTDAQGVLLTDLLFPSWTSLDYTISADGFADAIGTVNMQQEDLVVDPIVLERAYEITFTVNDGTNPVMGASVLINNTDLYTDASGMVVFPKMINGDYQFVISTPGYVDMAGTVTVMDANAAKTVTLAMGYNLTINVINGPDGTVGLANDTITINGISKITGVDGIVVFGVAPNSEVSFINMKAGFIDVPVDIASVTSDMTQTINMVPVYNVVIRAFDGNTYNPIAGATVVFNSITATTDADGNAYFPNTEPSTNAYEYTVTGEAPYNSVTGSISLPFTSTEEFLYSNNAVTQTEYLTSPGVYISLVNGWMSYFGPATITFDGTDYEYNTGLGGNSINCGLGTHTYVITPEDVTKAILRGTVELTELEPNANLWLDVLDAHKIEIYTIDAASDPVEGAAVTLNGITVLTDNTGLALFDRYSAGSYTYTITKQDYASVAETALEVNTEDVLEVVTLDFNTGIRNISAGTIKLYPNPTNGILNVNLPGNNGKEVTVRITNVIGAVIRTQKVNSASQFKLDFSGFDNGVYFINVKGNGFESTTKVVKN